MAVLEMEVLALGLAVPLSCLTHPLSRSVQSSPPCCLLPLRCSCWLYRMQYSARTPPPARPVRTPPPARPVRTPPPARPVLTRRAAVRVDMAGGGVQPCRLQRLSARCHSLARVLFCAPRGAAGAVHTHAVPTHAPLSPPMPLCVLVLCVHSRPSTHMAVLCCSMRSCAGHAV